MWKQYNCQVSNIRRTSTDNWIVNYSDVVRASPVGAAPTTSSFSTLHLASIYCANTTASRDEKHFSCWIWRDLYQRFYGSQATVQPLVGLFIPTDVAMERLKCHWLLMSINMNANQSIASIANPKVKLETLTISLKKINIIIQSSHRCTS